MTTTAHEGMMHNMTKNNFFEEKTASINLHSYNAVDSLFFMRT